MHERSNVHLNRLGSRLFRRRELLALGGTMGLAAMSRLRQTHASETRGGVTLQMRVMPLEDPRGFDWSEMGNIARGVIEPLVRYRSDFTFEPWLLSGWEVSETAETYVLRVRPGVTWSTGEPFTADDVIYNFERWCDRTAPANSMATRMSSLIDPGTGRAQSGAIERLDRQTLRLNLRRPDISIIASLTDYPALIVHPRFDAEGGVFSAAPIGTGPYTLASHIPGVEARLDRRLGWWGGSVALDHVLYVDLGENPFEHVRALDAGEVDGVYETTGAYVELLDDMDLVRSDVLTAATLVCRANRETGPNAYSDPRVRRALALAVDNETVLELGYAGLGTVAANHHVGPMHPDYAEIGTPRHDPGAAIGLLAEAGARGLTHELTSLDDEWNRATADVIAAQLRDAGIQVERQILAGGRFWRDWQRHPFSCTEWNMRPLGVQVLALAYASSGPWNETGFANTAFDEGIAEALSQVDGDVRSSVMAELQRMLIEDGTMIQPFWRRLFHHHRRALRGYVRHPTNEHHHDLWSVDA
ncbi:MAG: ABC transporter substrate-binding protein [Pseudomonadota bacterium]